MDRKDVVDALAPYFAQWLQSRFDKPGPGSNPDSPIILPGEIVDPRFVNSKFRYGVFAPDGEQLTSLSNQSAAEVRARGKEPRYVVDQATRQVVYVNGMCPVKPGQLV